MPIDLPAPEDLYLTNIDVSWRLFTIAEALDWRWTITQILEQPEDLLDDMLVLRSLTETVRRSRKK